MTLRGILAWLRGVGREAAPAAVGTAASSPPATADLAAAEAPAAAPPLSSGAPPWQVRDLAWLLQQFEGVRLVPYLCPAGVPTIGIGTTRYPGGRRVTLADPPITEAAAHAYALADLAEAAGDVRDLMAGTPHQLAPHEWAALALFVHNLGPGALHDSTLLKRLWWGIRGKDIADAWQLWCKARDPKTRELRPLKGLQRRRRAEVALFEGAPARQAWQTALEAFP